MTEQEQAIPRATRRRRKEFRSSPEAEARVLLLIDTFSRSPRGLPRLLEGRVKLAKLDFLVRYPRHMRRVLERVGAPLKDLQLLDELEGPIDARMMRYRYGPWDPAYYAILGSLVGRGLVELVPSSRGVGFRTTERGASVAAGLAEDEVFADLLDRLRIARKHLDKSGTTLKAYLYELPEVADASWREVVR